MTEGMRFLLYSDGSIYADRALDLGKWLAIAMAGEVDILAVANRDRSGEVDRIVEDVAEGLREEGLSVNVQQRTGALAEEIVHQADDVCYDLLVIGSRDRRGIRRLLLGSRACYIVGHAVASVLVVKGRPREQIERILVCTAAGPASEPTVRFAARLAHAVGASVTLLHVMSQLPLAVKDAVLDDLEAQAEELVELDAREGLHLEQMLEILDAEDVTARAVVRHGLVVDEVVAEIREGQFDLLAIGSHVTPGIGMPWVDDLAEQILLSVGLPVLVVHQT